MGIVIVSHSARLAEGVAELAREMGGPDLALETAGGLDLPEQPLGTDAAMVIRAIERADSGRGVLVLMDLGSAVLSAEMALDMLPEDLKERVLLCEAPLVEGAVAAAVTARIGAPLDQVAEEARGALAAKASHLQAEPVAAPSAPIRQGEGVSARMVVENPLGLHARPAARFVQTASAFDADVQVTNLATGRGPVSARSLNAIATLGVRQGHEILVTARGDHSAQAIAALEDLRDRNFDEAAAEPVPIPVQPPPPLPPAGAAAGRMLRGLPASPGIASGPARRVDVATVAVPAEAAMDPEEEWKRLKTALREVATEITAMRDSVASRAGPYEAGIFDAHLLFLQDEALVEPARRSIYEHRSNAARAWYEAANTVADQYRALDDDYQRARAEDVMAVARSVVAHLVGEGSARPLLHESGILIAPELTPADTAGLDPDLVRAIATAFGGPTSHSAILARSLGLPGVVGLGQDVLSVAEGTPVLVDGEGGLVYVEPSPELLSEYEARARTLAQAELAAKVAAGRPAVTTDGRRIEVVANVGSQADASAGLEAGAEGVGLLRSEFLFLGRDSVPDEEEQYGAYRAICQAMDGRPVILRTLDVGADKPLPYLTRAIEANPFLGVRGIRLSLVERELLRIQLRAALRVAAEYPLRLMFPMVTTVAELREAGALVTSAREDLRAGGMSTPESLPTGIMIEVPAAALTADRFAPDVDFFSIGTNDLSQYTMAADRGNERVASLANPLHPAVLRLIDRVVRAADAEGKWVGVCGEMAGDPRAVPILVGLGIRELSMSAPGIPRVKQVIRALNFAGAKALARRALQLDSAASVAGLVQEEAPSLSDEREVTLPGSGPSEVPQS